MPLSFGNLHNHELNKNKTNGHIKVDEVNLLALSHTHRSVGTEESWKEEWREECNNWLSLPHSNFHSSHALLLIWLDLETTSDLMAQDLPSAFKNYICFMVM